MPYTAMFDKTVPTFRIAIKLPRSFSTDVISGIIARWEICTIAQEVETDKDILEKECKYLKSVSIHNQSQGHMELGAVFMTEG